MDKQQKVVLKLSMENPKKRAKAMRCVVGLRGVKSASHEGDTMTVVGEGIDSVKLTTLLRKKMKLYVELVMVAAVEKKKEAEAKGSTDPLISTGYYGPVGAMMQPPYYYVAVREPSYEPNICSIM